MSPVRYLEGKEFISDTDSPDSTWPDVCIHPDDQPHVLEVINEAIQTRSIFEPEHRVLRVDGTLGWTHSRAIPILDADDEVIEWFGTARLLSLDNDSLAARELKRACMVLLLVRAGIEEIAPESIAVAAYWSTASGISDIALFIDIPAIDDESQVDHDRVPALEAAPGRQMQLAVVPYYRWEHMKEEGDPFVASVLQNHIPSGGLRYEMVRVHRSGSHALRPDGSEPTAKPLAHPIDLLYIFIQHP